VVGKINYKYDGITYTTELIANNDVTESKVLFNLVRLLIASLIIYIIYNNRKINRKNKKNGNKIKRKKKK